MTTSVLGEPNKRFSEELEAWLSNKKPKTLASVSETFGEKAFAVTFLLLMILPALPVPTGGLTHVFEAITVIIASPMLIGRKTFWLPGFVGSYKLGKLTTGKVLPALLKLVRKLERFSRPRWGKLMDLVPFRIVTGVVVIGLCIAAALAPPFSGLDTIPALGVVIIALGIILDDFVVYIIGIIAGALGIASVVFLGSLAVQGIRALL